MNNKDSIIIPDTITTETNMIDHPCGGNLGFTSSAPPEMPITPSKPKPANEKK